MAWDLLVVQWSTAEFNTLLRFYLAPSPSFRGKAMQQLEYSSPFRVIQEATREGA